MKIVINYDLLEKINETKRGFNLVKNTKLGVLMGISCITFLYMFCYMIVDDIISFANLFQKFPMYVIYSSTLSIIINLVLENFDGLQVKKRAINELILLSNQLKTCTDADIDISELLETYKYHAEYKINKDGKMIPSIMQRKYFNVPIENGKELSLCQEHILGSKKYVLTKGKHIKEKALSFALNYS